MPKKHVRKYTMVNECVMRTHIIIWVASEQKKIRFPRNFICRDFLIVCATLKRRVVGLRTLPSWRFQPRTEQSLFTGKAFHNKYCIFAYLHESLYHAVFCRQRCTRDAAENERFIRIFLRVSPLPARTESRA